MAAKLISNRVTSSLVGRMSGAKLSNALAAVRNDCLVIDIDTNLIFTCVAVLGCGGRGCVTGEEEG